jgi:DNA-binding NarL/FixJ family response regulator
VTAAASGTGDVLRVVIVDDQPVMRSGLAMIMSAHDDLEVVGEAGDGREGIDLVAATSPDVVLMDIQMPELDGIEATRRLVREGAEARVLILTTFGQEQYVFDAFEAGAAGFLLKTAEPRLIVDAVRTVAAGNSLLAPQLTQQIIDSYLAGRRAPSLPAAYGRLTEREQEVLRCLAGGLSNAEIARELFIGEGTVKTHVARILDKLALRDRVQAVVFAHRHGLVR